MYTQFVALSNVELTRDDDDDYCGGEAEHNIMRVSKQRELRKEQYKRRK